jgi:hypothetical protein
MTRSLSGGVLAGTDEPLMFGLAFPTGYLEQCNLWVGRLAGKCLEFRLYLFAGLGGVVRPPHSRVQVTSGTGSRRAHRTSEDAHRAALLGTVEQLVRHMLVKLRPAFVVSPNLKNTI